MTEDARIFSKIEAKKFAISTALELHKYSIGKVLSVNINSLESKGSFNTEKLMQLMEQQGTMIAHNKDKEETPMDLILTDAKQIFNWIME